jgi:hypothetical protein
MGVLVLGKGSNCSAHNNLLSFLCVGLRSGDTCYACALNFICLPLRFLAIRNDRWLGLMEHRLVKARTPTPGLVHNERQWPIIFVHGSTHTGAALDSTPDGKEGWHSYAVRHNLAAARFGNLELHVGLPDRDLLGIACGRTCSVFCDLGYAADEK